MPTCKNCAEELPKNPWGAFCSGFCAEEYELSGGDEALDKIINENMEHSMLGFPEDQPSPEDVESMRAALAKLPSYF